MTKEFKKHSQGLLDHEKLICFENLNHSLETDFEPIKINQEQFDMLWEKLEAVATFSQLDSWKEGYSKVNHEEHYEKYE